MTNIKLIALDLDGTLLNSSLAISDANRRALRMAMERGVAVAVNTGRMFASARVFADQIGTTMPLICYNGAMVRGADRVISHLTLDLGVARTLLAIFRDRGIYIQSYIDDVLYLRQMDAESTSYISLFGVDGRFVGDELYNPASAPTKLLAITNGLEHSHAITEDLAAIFGDKLYITISNANFVEMMSPLANKSDRLKELAESLGIGMESVMAIGDGENDVQMVSRAGVGIAMGNGLDLIRSAADDIAPTNDEDGVAWAVEKYVLR